MKRLWMSLVPLALVLAGCSSTPASSGDACPQPLTKVSPTQVTPGQTVTVSAADMWQGCNDQGSHPKLPPLKDQPVIMTVEGKAVGLSRVSADQNTGQAQTEVTVPATAAPGMLYLTIGSAQRAAVTVTAR